MAKLGAKVQSDRSSVICRALRHAIIAQELMPGAKLPEDAIGEQFGASRTIVRNALGQLAAEGLVELRRNRGASVAAPSWGEAHDIFDVRLALEQLVAARLTGALSPAQIAALSAHVDQEERARGRDNTLSIRLATEFHILLAEMTGSTVLMRYVRELASRCGLTLSLYSRPHSSECAVSEHRAIIATLKGKNPARAISLMSEHLQSVVKRALIHKPVEVQRDVRDILSAYSENGHKKGATAGKR